MNTDQKGTLTEYQCITYLLGLGYNVCVPAVPCKYDFILDYNGRFIRIQVKTSSLSKDRRYIKFYPVTSSRRSYGYTTSRYSRDDVDYFMTFYDGDAYLVRVGEVSTVKKLWLVKPNPSGCSTPCMAEEYLFEKVISKS